MSKTTNKFSPEIRARAVRIALTSFLAGTGAGEMQGFWLLFTLLGVTMSQKSSVTQIATLVPQALTAGAFAAYVLVAFDLVS
jgi:hypothetical protein